jgi:hypothetical protein
MSAVRSSRACEMPRSAERSGEAATRRAHPRVRPGALVNDGLSLALEVGGVESVISIDELNDSSSSTANRAIVASREILESLSSPSESAPELPAQRSDKTHLHETTGHVTSFGGLDGGIDQSFTSRNGVEEELGGEKSGVEGVADKSLGRRVLGALGEVRQRAILETVGHTMTGDNLLSDTSDHLRDVDLGSCGAGRERGSAFKRARRSEPTSLPLEPQVAMIKGALLRLSSVIQISPTLSRTRERVPEIIDSSVSSVLDPGWFSSLPVAALWMRSFDSA